MLRNRFVSDATMEINLRKSAPKQRKKAAQGQAKVPTSTPVHTAAPDVEESRDIDDGEASSALTEVSEAPFAKWEAKRARSRNARFSQTSNPYDSANSTVDDEASEEDHQIDQEWDELHDITEQPEHDDADDEIDTGDEEWPRTRFESEEQSADCGDDEKIESEEDELVEVDENDLTDDDIESIVVVTTEHTQWNDNAEDISNLQKEYPQSALKSKKISKQSTPATPTQDDTASIFSENNNGPTPATEQSDDEIEGEGRSSWIWRVKADEALQDFFFQQILQEQQTMADTQGVTRRSSSIGLVDDVNLSRMGEAAKGPKAAWKFVDFPDELAHGPEDPLEGGLHISQRDNASLDAPPLASRPDSDEWYFLPAIRQAAQAMIGIHDVVRQAGGTSKKALQPQSTLISSLLQNLPPIFMKETDRLTGKEKMKMQRLVERVQHQMVFLGGCHLGVLGPGDLWNLEIIAKYGNLLG